MDRNKTRASLGLKCCDSRCVNVLHLPNTERILRQALPLGLVCDGRECGVEQRTEARLRAPGRAELSEGEAAWRPREPGRVRPAGSPAPWSSPRPGLPALGPVCLFLSVPGSGRTQGHYLLVFQSLLPHWVFPSGQPALGGVGRASGARTGQRCQGVSPGTWHWPIRPYGAEVLSGWWRWGQRPPSQRLSVVRPG